MPEDIDPKDIVWMPLMRSKKRPQPRVPLLISKHTARAKKNHSQGLELLAPRGGLIATETIAVILDLPWNEVRWDDDAAESFVLGYCDSMEARGYVSKI